MNRRLPVFLAFGGGVAFGGGLFDVLESGILSGGSLAAIGGAVMLFVAAAISEG